MDDAAELLVRYLRQRQTLGESELLLSPGTLEALRSDPVTGEPPAPRTSAAAPISVVGDASNGGAVAPADHAVPAASIATGGGTALEVLRESAMGCVACGLSRTRTTVVFGEGDPRAKLMVVGEAPGADEDREGRPFVGRAGKLLNTLLASIGFPRSSVYICNVLKCRPPMNRNPAPAEVEACAPFLRRQIEAVAPEAILAVGTFPAQTLLGTKDPIGRLRGSVYEYQGVPLVPTYHPAALLRNPNWIRPVWEDLQRLRAIIDG